MGAGGEEEDDGSNGSDFGSGLEARPFQTWADGDEWSTGQLAGEEPDPDPDPCIVNGEDGVLRCAAECSNPRGCGSCPSVQVAAVGEE